MQRNESLKIKRDYNQQYSMEKSLSVWIFMSSTHKTGWIWLRAPGKCFGASLCFLIMSFFVSSEQLLVMASRYFSSKIYIHIHTYIMRTQNLCKVFSFSLLVSYLAFALASLVEIGRIIGILDLLLQFLRGDFFLIRHVLLFTVFRVVAAHRNSILK